MKFKSLILISAAITATSAHASFFDTFNSDYLLKQFGVTFSNSVQQSSDLAIKVTRPAITSSSLTSAIDYYKERSIDNSNLNAGFDFSLLYKSLDPTLSYGVTFNYSVLDLPNLTYAVEPITTVVSELETDKIYYASNASQIKFDGYSLGLGAKVLKEFPNHTFISDLVYPYLSAEIGVKYIRYNVAGFYSFTAYESKDSNIKEYNLPLNPVAHLSTFRPYASAAIGLRSDNIYASIGFSYSSFSIENDSSTRLLTIPPTSGPPVGGNVNYSLKGNINDRKIIFSFGVIF